MKKLLSFLGVASLLSISGTVFASTSICVNKVNDAATNLENWNEAVSLYLVKDIGFPANLGFLAAKETFKSKTAPVSGAIDDLVSFCDIATEQDEVIRYFKALAFAAGKTSGPVGGYISAELDMAVWALEAINEIGNNIGFSASADGLLTIRLSLKGEGCKKGWIYDSDCDWTNNDFSKVIESVELIGSDGVPVQGYISNCRGVEICYSREPVDAVRVYDFNVGQPIKAIKITMYKDSQRIYIPFDRKFVKIEGYHALIPLYINNKKYVTYRRP